MFYFILYTGIQFKITLYSKLMLALRNKFITKLFKPFFIFITLDMILTTSILFSLYQNFPTCLTKSLCSPINRFTLIGLHNMFHPEITEITKTMVK